MKAVDPVLALVNALANWMWHQVGALATIWLAKMVFRPIAWQRPVLQLYAMSRDLAWSMVGLVVILIALKSLWPQLQVPMGRLAVPFFLERLMTAGLIGWAGVWLVQAGLEINNALVSVIVANAGQWTWHPVVGGVLSPVVVLLVMMAILVLLLYLAVFYAMRAIELFLLAAAIPWFALWWAIREDDRILSSLSREIGAVTFIQSFHAAAFWLALRLMSDGNWGATGLFIELALLWYMARLPGQLRRLMGAGMGGTRFWR